MAETLRSASSEPGTPLSSAAEQARIRKERREAKILAGGSQRLNKITGLGGGIQRDLPPQPSVAAAPDPTSLADPEEVDISQHFYQPASTTRPHIPQLHQTDTQLSDEQLRAMMLGITHSGRGTPQPLPGNTPFAGFPGPGSTTSTPGPDDPMLKLLQQMVGPFLGVEGGPGRDSRMPAMSKPSQEGGDREAPGLASPGGDPYAYLWRIVHAVFALGLGLYIALTANFTGTKLARDIEITVEGSALGRSNVQFFYIFATCETILQTLRFTLEKGTIQPGGVLGMAMRFLPQPWKGYLSLMLRYGRIWATTSVDALVCVFVLGVCSWLRAT